MQFDLIWMILSDLFRLCMVFHELEGDAIRAAVLTVTGPWPNQVSLRETPPD